MEIKLTLKQFEELRQLSQIVEASLIRGSTKGEVHNVSNKVEWEEDEDEVKFTLA